MPSALRQVPVAINAKRIALVCHWAKCIASRSRALWQCASACACRIVAPSVLRQVYCAKSVVLSALCQVHKCIVPCAKCTALMHFQVHCAQVHCAKVPCAHVHVPVSGALCQVHCANVPSALCQGQLHCANVPVHVPTASSAKCIASSPLCQVHCVKVRAALLCQVCCTKSIAPSPLC